MPISDPAQLLQRVPELEAVAGDPAIKRAIESGDPFKVYRALVWARWLGRLPQHRETLKLLIRQRRLFAKPFKRVPALGTINSFGFSFVGEAERNNDGSYIALHALVVLFAIPLVPLGAYLVTSTGSRQWQIYARVPIGIFGWLYSRGLALMLIVTILGGAISSFHQSQTRDITVLNGFATPLEIVLSDKRQTVPAQGRIVINVATGAIKGSATSAQYGVIDTYSQTVNSHGGYTIWNIAGAMPLMREQVTYYQTVPANAAEADNMQTVYCGQRYIETDSADFAFEEPAKTVSMSKYETVVHRSHLDIIRVDGRTSFDICAGYLLSVNKVQQAGPLFEAQARLTNWDANLTNTAVTIAGSLAAAEGVRIARQAITAKPDNVELNRIYQTASDNAGQFNHLLQEYTQQANQHPDSATAQYLHAVLLKGPQGLAEFERLAVQFDRNPYILRALTWRRTNAGDYAGAIESYARLKSIAPDIAAGMLSEQMQALVAQKRLPEALDAIVASFHDPKDRNPTKDAGDYALIANLAGADPALLLTEISQTSNNANSIDAIRVRAGLEPLQAMDKRSKLVNFELGLRSDPVQALKLAHALNRSELINLQMEQTALLYCEAARTGDEPLLALLKFNFSVPRSDREALEKFVKGEPVSLADFSLDPSVQAAAFFIRSRNAGLPAPERNALRQRAAETDLLHTVITQALQQWPA